MIQKVKLIITKIKLFIHMVWSKRVNSAEASAFRERSPHGSPDEPGDMSRETIAKCSCKFLFGGYLDEMNAFLESNRLA